MSNSPRSLVVHQRRRWKQPLWLRFLFFIQHSSSIITFCLIFMTLSVYAGVVYSQQQWSARYKELKNIQRNHRNLVTTNETLKNQLADQAESPESGFVSPNPANTIFLPSSGGQDSFIRSPESNTQAPNSKENTPIGY